MPVPAVEGPPGPAPPPPRDGVANESVPIMINNDSVLRSIATLYGWAGNGSWDNPYIIENLTINGSGSSYCLSIATQSDVIIRNNHFFGTTERSYGNYFWENGGLGIRGCRNITIENNTFEDHYIAGIALYHARAAVFNNTLFDSGGGITIVSGSDVIKGNTLVRCQMVINGYPTVEENTFVGDGGGYGIIVSKWHPRSVSSNTFSNLSTGITVQYETTTVYDNNTFKNCDRAYYLRADSITVNNSTIVDCPGGIALEGGSATLMSNTMTRSGITFYSHHNQESMYLSHNISTSNEVNGKPVLYKLNASDIVVDPSSYGEYILVNCSNVTFTNRTITNSFWFYALFSDNVTIEDNSADMDPRCDWWVQDSQDITIANNSVVMAVLDLWNADRLEVSNNSLHGVPTSISGEGRYSVHNNSWTHYGGGYAVTATVFRKDGTFMDNNITVVNPPFGLLSSGSYALFVSSLEASLKLRNNHLVGAGLLDTRTRAYEDEDLDIDTSNTVNGRPILHLTSVSNRRIQGEYGQVIVRASDGITVEGLDMGRGDGGVWLYSSGNLSVQNCTFRDLHTGAIIMYYCSNTSVTDSLFEGGNSQIFMGYCNEDKVKPYGDIVSNYFLNITLEDYWDSVLELWNSNINDIKYNYFNNTTGVALGSSSLVNEIIGNEIRNCSNWAYHSATPDVKVHHNSFLDNRIYLGTQVGQIGSNNQWDDGSEGNYYSNYETRYPDATNDGTVWDTPYVFWRSNTQDDHPLVKYTDRIAPMVRLYQSDSSTNPDTDVTFSAWAIDNIGVTLYQWSFDGGQTWTNTTSGSITHRFSKPGDKYIVLKVRDAANNTAEATGTIHVMDVTPPPRWPATTSPWHRRRGST